MSFKLKSAALAPAIVAVLCSCEQNFSVRTSEDTEPPRVVQIASRSGTHASRNFVAFDVRARDNRGVAAYCVFRKYPHEDPPARPSPTDPCWKTLPVALENERQFSHDVFFGFLPYRYDVYVFLKDFADNVSFLSNDGKGTADVDKFTYSLDPLVPPGLINVTAASRDLSEISYERNDQQIGEGGNVFVKWKTLPQAAGLAAGPIALHASTDGLNWQKIAEGLLDGANASCSLGSMFSGCHVFPNPYPAGTAFKVRVQVTDTNGVRTVFSTLANTKGFHQLAGYTDNGVGGSAASAIFSDWNQNYTADRNLFVVSETGDIYIRDPQGLLRIEPNTGNLSVLIPQTGSFQDGPVESAQLKQMRSIFIDFQDRVLIYDSDRVRVYDPVTRTLGTIIGGGTSREDGVSASEFRMAASDKTYFSLSTLPNGDVYFIDGFKEFKDEDQFYFKYEPRSNKVLRFRISGKGVNGDPGLNFNEHPKTTYPFYYAAGMGFEYDPATSTVTQAALKVNVCANIGCGYGAYSTLLNPATGTVLPTEAQTLPLPPASQWRAWNNFIPSMEGSLYFLTKADAYNESRLVRFDRTTRSWVDLFDPTIGVCPEGTPARQCKTRIEDAFISRRGEVYIYDGGAIRAVGIDQRVYTIFGQRRFYGDGLKSVNARFNRINSFGVNHLGEVVLLDSLEGLIRKFNLQDFVMQPVAGNSDGGSIPLAGQPPRTTGITPGYWGADYRMMVSPVDGAIYLTDGAVNRLAHGASQWEKVGVGTASNYATHATLPASAIKFDYPVILSGIHEGRLILTGGSWDRDHLDKNGMLKVLDLGESQARHLAGAIRDSYQAGPYAGSVVYFPDEDIGKPAADANINAVQFHNRAGTLKYNPRLGSWLSAAPGSSRIVSVPEGGLLSKYVTLPRALRNFTVRSAPGGQDRTYICATDGQLYRYTGTVETRLSLPAHYSCSGQDLHYQEDRGSLLFVYENNGLMGVAEYFDAPPTLPEEH